jgi:CubicO group peptidase (beta-lactamase class C family)
MPIDSHAVGGKDRAVHLSAGSARRIMPIDSHAVGDKDRAVHSPRGSTALAGNAVHGGTRSTLPGLRFWKQQNVQRADRLRRTGNDLPTQLGCQGPRQLAAQPAPTRAGGRRRAVIQAHAIVRHPRQGT